MLPQQSQPPRSLVFLPKCSEEVQIWHLLQSTKRNREKYNEGCCVYNSENPKYIKTVGEGVHVWDVRRVMQTTREKMT